MAVIGVADLLRNAKELVSTEFVIYPFLIAGLVYLVLSTVLIAGFDRLEKKYSVYS
jgi:polar amino acid transport system permease protein